MYGRTVRRLSSSTPPPLLVWQKDAIEASCNAIKTGFTKFGLQLPKGPTRISTLMSLIPHIPAPLTNRGATRIIIVTVGTSTAQTIFEAVGKYFPHLSAQIEWKELGSTGNADISITTYRQLPFAKTARKLTAASTKAIILDEAHHSQRDFFKTLMSHYDPQRRFKVYKLPKHSHCPMIIAISSHEDTNFVQQKIPAFDHLVFRRDFAMELEDTWQCPLIFSSIPVELKLSEFSLDDKYAIRQLSKRMRRPHVLDAIVRAYLDRPDCKSIFIHCVDSTHADTLLTAFKKVNVDARFVHQEMSELARKETMNAFRAREFPVLLYTKADHETVWIYTLCNVDCVILAKPMPDSRSLADQICHGAKSFPDKPNCHIVQITDSSTPLSKAFTLHKLFHLNPTEPITNEDAAELRRRSELQSYMETPLNTNPDRVKEEETPIVEQGKEPENQATFEIALNSVVEEKTQQDTDMDEVEEKTPTKSQRLIKVNKVPITFEPEFYELNKRSAADWIWCGKHHYAYDRGSRGYAMIVKCGGENSVPRFRAFFDPNPLHGGNKNLRVQDITTRMEGEFLDKTITLVDKYLLDTYGRGILQSTKPKRNGAAPEQKVALKRFWKVDHVEDILQDGKPMEKDEVLEWMNQVEASAALLRLRRSRDAPVLLRSELNAIASRIRKGITAWKQKLDRRRTMRENRRKKKEAKLESARQRKQNRAEKAAKILARSASHRPTSS